MRRRMIVLGVALAFLGCESTGGSGGGLGGGGGYRDAHTLQWYEAKSKHFTLYGAASEEQLTEVAQRLELFRSTVQVVTGKQFPPPRIPLQLVAFDRTSKMKAFADLEGARIIESVQRNTIVFSLQRMGRSDAYAPVQWAYTRFLLDHHGKYAYPSWYQHGMARFLSAVKVLKDGRVEVGAVPGTKQRQLLPYMGPRWRPLRDVFTRTHGDWISPYQFRAECWAVIHYLNFGPQRYGANQKLNRYVRRVDAGADPGDAIAETFGYSVESLDRDVRSYMMKQEYQSAVYERSTFPHDDKVTVRPVGQAEIAVLLGNLSLDAAGSRENWRPGYGKAKFQQADHYFTAAIAADASRKQEAQAGRVRAQLGVEALAEAEAIAEELVAGAPDSAVAQLAMGNVVFARASAATDATERQKLARLARKHYVKAWKLDANVPETHAMYGSTYLLDGQDARKGVNTLEHAKSLLPSSVAIRYMLATLYLKAGENDKARNLALSIIYSDLSEEMNKRAEELLEAAEA